MAEPPGSPNPYESRPIKADAATKLSTGKTVMLVLLTLLLVPAAAIACFITCSGTVLVIADPRGLNLDAAMMTGFVLGAIAGITTLVAGSVFIQRLTHSWNQPTK